MVSRTVKLILILFFGLMVFCIFFYNGSALFNAIIVTALVLWSIEIIVEMKSEQEDK